MERLPHGWLAFEPTAGDLAGQIYRSLRDRILAGDLPSSARLPSTRSLSRTLGVSRTTVVAAFDRLRAEGYVTARSGSSTRLATLPPLRPVKTPLPGLPVSDAVVGADGLFRPGVPDLTQFPHRVWARCLAGRARALRLHDLGYGDRTGLPALREAILAHIAATRGIVATAAQVIVVPSASTAIALIGKHVVQPGGPPVWIEDPAYGAARHALLNIGATLVPVPVDADGMTLGGALPPPCLVYVTPSHQYPTGVTMSLPRRLALIETAHASGALIIEDDYDSEFFDGPPVAALQSIDRAGVVAYVGTFSKTLAPGVRMAYMVLPTSLVAEIALQQELFGAHVAIHIQAALADFINDGHFRAYIRKMGPIYRENGKAIAAAFEQHCPSLVRLGKRSGLQLACWFTQQAIDDRKFAATLAERGFPVEPMSQYYLGPSAPGLLIGMSGPSNRAPGLAEAVYEVFPTHLS